MRNIIIAAWQDIQAHMADKKIKEILKKHEIDDYIIFIRTPQASFTTYTAAYSSIAKQIAHLIQDISDQQGTSARMLIRSIQQTIEDISNIKIDLEDLRSRKDSLSKEEQREEMREILKKYNISDNKLEDALKML